MRWIYKNTVVSIFIYLIFLNVSGQISNQQKLWSGKDKRTFYQKYSLDTSILNEIKVMDCMFEKIQKKFSSFKNFEENEQSIISIKKNCSLMVYIPITEQLSNKQSDIIHDEMLRLVNMFRKENGNVNLLILDTDLDVAAKIQADYNAWRNDLSHEQVGNNEYSTIVKRIFSVKKNQNIKQSICGENIAEISYEPDSLNDTQYLLLLTKELFKTWEDSEGHRENMLFSYYKYFGFAITVNAEEETLYATQVFSSLK